MAYRTDIIFNLKYTIKKIIYSNNEGKAIIKIRLKKSVNYPDPLPKEILLKGVYANAFNGDTYQGDVQFEYDKKYGYSLKQAGVHELVLPHSNKELAKFLKQRTENVGEELLKRVIDEIGIDVISKVADDPTILDKIERLPEKKKLSIIKACKENVIFEGLFAFLMYEGFPASLAAKIYKVYGYSSLSQIRKNPYEMFMKGIIGFEEADELAFRNKVFSWNSLERNKAIVYNVILNNENQKGNTFISEHCLKTMVQYYILNTLKSSYGKQKMSDSDLNDAIVNLIATNVIVKTKYTYGDNVTIVYIRKIVYDTELNIVKMLLERINAENHMCVPEKTLEDYFTNLKNVKISDEQKSAITMALRNKFSILTGGPGTGKTYTVNLIVSTLKKMFKKPEITLLAPTGRAAYRITQVSGQEAKTIHSALHLFEDNNDSDNKYILKSDFVIIDEASMIDERLFEILLKRIDNSASILLVGDNDQLPSVSIGNVLGDLLDTEYIPFTELKQIFRQQGTSRIVENAHKIKSGLNENIKNISFGKNKNDDFRIIESNNEDFCADNVIKEYKRLLANEEIEDILVISPMRAGFAGIDNLNSRIQNEVNPKREGVFEIRRGDKILREGDRVIHTKNNRDLQVVNGALGTIQGIYYDEDKKQDIVDVLFDGEDDVIRYAKDDDLKELELGYCISIHKSQGSEIKHIIMPLTQRHLIMLRRRLMYTAITRAKESFCCVGNRNLFIESCLNTKGDQRYSLLENILISKE